MNKELFNHWECTDSDCAQYIRSNGTIYQMIQFIWLDATKEELEDGFKPYLVAKCEIDMSSLTREEINFYASLYSYDVVKLEEEYGSQVARDIIAECVLETDCFSCGGCDKVGEFTTEEEARNCIKDYIHNQSTMSCNIGFINSKGEEDKTQIDFDVSTPEEEEIERMNTILSLQKEMDIKEIIYIDILE